MTRSRESATAKRLVASFVVLLAALVIYCGAYRAMASNVGSLPHYLLFGRPAKPQAFWETLFLPAWLVDRVVRYDYWYPS